MPRFRKKVLEFEAWQNLGSAPYPTWMWEAIDSGLIQIEGNSYTLLGGNNIPVPEGDWIVQPIGTKNVLLCSDQLMKLEFEPTEPNSATTPCNTSHGRKRSWKDLFSRYLRKGRN